MYYFLCMHVCASCNIILRTEVLIAVVVVLDILIDLKKKKIIFSEKI